MSRTDLVTSILADDAAVRAILDLYKSDDGRVIHWLAKELFMASPFQVCRTSELEAEWAALEPDVRRIWYDTAARRLLTAPTEPITVRVPWWKRGWLRGLASRP